MAERRADDDAARIAELSSLGDGGSVEELMQILATTDDAQVRNSCAIALGDLRVSGLAHAVARLLQDPRTEGQRGTLVYALSGVDVGEILDILVRTAVSDQYEASAEATTRIDEFEGEIDAPMWERCVLQLKNVLAEEKLLSEQQRANARHLASLFALEDA